MKYPVFTDTPTKQDVQGVRMVNMAKTHTKKTDIDLTFCKEGQREFILNFFGESYKFKNYHFQPIMFL